MSFSKTLNLTEFCVMCHARVMVLCARIMASGRTFIHTWVMGCISFNWRSLSVGLSYWRLEVALFTRLAASTHLKMRLLSWRLWQGTWNKFNLSTSAKKSRHTCVIGLAWSTGRYTIVEKAPERNQNGTPSTSMCLSGGEKLSKRPCSILRILNLITSQRDRSGDHQIKIWETTP